MGKLDCLQKGLDATHALAHIHVITRAIEPNSDLDVTKDSGAVPDASTTTSPACQYMRPQTREWGW